MMARSKPKARSQAKPARTTPGKKAAPKAKAAYRLKAAGKAKPRKKGIPEGFATLTAHIVVEGAADAMDFYKRAFGAEEIGRAPMPDGKKLMHGLMKIGDSMLMLVDAFPEYGAKD